MEMWGSQLDEKTGALAKGRLEITRKVSTKRPCKVTRMDGIPRARVRSAWFLEGGHGNRAWVAGVFSDN